MVAKGLFEFTWDADPDPAQPRAVIIPTADEIIQPDDKLLIFGTDKKIDALAQDS